jgi:HAMP domain-containing protein
MPSPNDQEEEPFQKEMDYEEDGLDELDEESFFDAFFLLAAETIGAVIAKQLAIPLAELQAQHETTQLARLIEVHGATTTTLISTIMRAEAARLQQAPSHFPDEQILLLAETLTWVKEYISGPSTEDCDEWEECADAEPYELEELKQLESLKNLDLRHNFVAEALLDGERVLVTDPRARIVYDSDENARVGETLSDAESYREEEQEFLDGIFQVLLISGLLTALVALLIGGLLTRSITTPVSALTTAVTRLAGGETTERLAVRSADELGQMSHAFNTLADSLDTQRHLRTQLIHDVSHELNTPLSVIQLEMEALRDGMQSDQKATQHVLREIDLLRNLANDLSLLAETDRGEIQLALTPVEMATFLPRGDCALTSRSMYSGTPPRLACPPPRPAPSPSGPSTPQPSYWQPNAKCHSVHTDRGTYHGQLLRWHDFTGPGGVAHHPHSGYWQWDCG